MKRTIYLLLIAFYALTLSCAENQEKDSDNATDNGEAVTEEKQSDEPAQGTKEFYVYEEADIDQTKLPELAGDIFLEKMWNDENGLNYLLFTKKVTRNEREHEPSDVSKELHAYHFKKSGTAMVLMREIKDFVLNCMHDNTLELIENSVNITDVDNDNYGEVTFMYKLGCRSDITPLDMKLMHLENGDKYAIRGNEKVQVGPEDYIGGKAKADATFNKVPERQNFAYQVWKSNGGEKPYTKEQKTLLNAEFLAGTWVLSGKSQDTKNLPPATLKFTKDGKLSYTIMEEDWIHTEWEMKQYPNVLTNLPGQLYVGEGDLFYRTKGLSGNRVDLLYHKK
jgi:hypothetical protein